MEREIKGDKMLMIGIILMAIGIGCLHEAYREYERQTTIRFNRCVFLLENHIGFWKWLFNKDK